MTIGVFDLQGGVLEHVDHLTRLGVSSRRVKTEQDFDGLSGLIIPGGESTCLSKLTRIFGLDVVICREFGRGLKIWGTCAGAILVANEVVGEQAHLGLLDMTVERNAFGSQLDSFCEEAIVPKVSDNPVPLTYIRAPKIHRVGADVEVLLRRDGFIAAAENDRVLVTVFHPELTPCLAFHRHFASKCGLTPAALCATAGDLIPAWERTSWMRQATGRSGPGR